MRKIVQTLLVLMLSFVLFVCAGCGKFDPMKQYAELSKNGSKNEDRIQSLVERCIRKGDFEDAGKILLEEAKAHRNDSYNLSDLQQKFKSHEKALDIEVWTNSFKKSIMHYYSILDYVKYKECTDAVLKILQDYNGIVYELFPDTEAALIYLTGEKLQDELYLDVDETLLKQCATAPKGKGLVYIIGPDKKTSSINLSMMAGMPADILPSSLDEVEYIVYMEYSLSRVGYYDNGGSAMRVDCDIRLVHMPDGKVLKTYAKANGGPPPKTITVPLKGSPGASGSYPRGSDILYTLKSAFLYIQDPSTI